MTQSFWLGKLCYTNNCHAGESTTHSQNDILGEVQFNKICTYKLSSDEFSTRFKLHCHAKLSLWFHNKMHAIGLVWIAFQHAKASYCIVSHHCYKIIRKYHFVANEIRECMPWELSRKIHDRKMHFSFKSLWKMHRLRTKDWIAISPRWIISIFHDELSRFLLRRQFPCRALHS